MLAIYLANRFPVEKLILLNAAAIYLSPRRYLSFLWERKVSQKQLEIFIRKKTPLSAIWQFMRLIQFIKKEIHHVQIPTLILQSTEDQIIHPRSALYLANKLQGESTLCYVPHARHLLCLDKEGEKFFRDIRNYL